MIGIGLLSSVATASAPGTQTAEVRRGAQLFVDTGCIHCHGSDGVGTDKAPSLRGVRQHLSDARVRDQIRNGGKSMPAFGDVLTDAQTGQLVAFLRSKAAWATPLPPPSTPDENTPAPQADTPHAVQ